MDHISPVTTMTSLEHVADTAAAGQVVRDYLAARGIRTTATLALMAKTESELEKHLMLPLFNGWKTESGSVLRIPPEEQPIVQAILLHMWSICRKQWADSMTPTPSLTATVPTSPGTASAKTSTSDDKVPKTLPPGTWSSLIRKYQEEQLHGVNRVFPQRELLGAESTLARMHHELHISRMFTPVQIGEIIEKRSFTASGDVNPLSKARKTQQLTVEDAQLVYHDEPTSWTPRSLLATLDGLTSIRWAMVLIEWGPELLKWRGCLHGSPRGPDHALRRWSNSIPTSPPSVGNCAWTCGAASVLQRLQRTSQRIWTDSQNICPETHQ